MKTKNSQGVSIRRLPGQGIREEFDRRFEKDIADPLMIVGFGIVACVIECTHVWGKTAPNIWTGFIVLLGTIAYASYRITKGRKKLRDLRRGEEGERIVASYIERDLIPRGYAAFHDILLSRGGKTFNIDHLLVGPNGVFAIETKNYSKPRGEAKVIYDGQRILWNHRKRGDEARQAQAIASAACEYIAELTGKRVFVQPVLCAVGWFASSTDLYGHRVLLVMEKTLGSVIPKMPIGTELSESDRQMLVARLRKATAEK